MKITHIGDVPITAERPFLIAEAGVNHEGSLDQAFALVDAAAEAGADMIKFQSYKAETLASKHSPAYWDRSKEPADSQYKLFKRYDALDVDDYKKLAQRCKKKNILFGTTPFDLQFTDALDELLPIYKIASADITNTILMRRIAQKKKPILLSTGASYLGEIESAVAFLKKEGVKSLGLLHCVLQYPTQPENSNLRALGQLQNTFPDLTIGWSDHVPPVDGCLAMITAWLLGATILEKHFTLNKNLPGNDHYHAMDPDDVVLFRRQQNQIGALLGSTEKTVYPCEEAARLQARRSLVAARDIPQGTKISADMLTAKRPGHGISPIHAELIIGRRAPKAIAADDVLTWDIFLGSST